LGTRWKPDDGSSIRVSMGLLAVAPGVMVSLVLLDSVLVLLDPSTPG
jgi:hypothetical protein